MLVNNIDINIFSGSVSKKLIQPTEIEIKKEKINLNIIKISNKSYLKRIEVKILFQGNNRSVIKNNISNFISNFTDEADIKFKNLQNSYHVYLVDSQIEDTEFDEWLYLNLELEGYEYGEEVSEIFNKISTKSINVNGNIITPAIVEIIPSTDIIDIVLEGLANDPITIKNIKANKKVIINGVEGTVTLDGSNKFADTDMWDFPFLKPGNNTIKFSKNNCNITIKYKPIYL